MELHPIFYRKRILITISDTSRHNGRHLHRRGVRISDTAARRSAPSANARGGSSPPTPRYGDAALFRRNDRSVNRAIFIAEKWRVVTNKTPMVPNRTTGDRRGGSNGANATRDELISWSEIRRIGSRRARPPTAWS